MDYAECTIILNEQGICMFAKEFGQMLERYTLSNLKTALGRPALFLWEAQRLLSIPFHRFGNQYFQSRNGDSIDVIDLNWEAFVTLDARRPITRSEPAEDHRLEEELVEDRLRALGYA